MAALSSSLSCSRARAGGRAPVRSSPLLARFASRRPAALPVAELADGLDYVSLTAGGLLAVAVAGIGGYRLYMYSQLEYVTAAMLSNWVPRGANSGKGARVVQMGGGTRELYYYPKNQVLQVDFVDENANKSLLDTAGMQAGVPSVARRQRATDALSFAASGSIDTLVCIGQLGKLGPEQRKLLFVEALRVLKPGAPLVFIERLKEGGSALRPLLSSSDTALELSALDALKANKQGWWENVAWDVALEGQDPHVLGVAQKSLKYRAPPASKLAAAQAQQRQAMPPPPAPAVSSSGFSSSGSAAMGGGVGGEGGEAAQGGAGEAGGPKQGTAGQQGAEGGPMGAGGSRKKKRGFSR